MCKYLEWRTHEISRRRWISCRSPSCGERERDLLFFVFAERAEKWHSLLKDQALSKRDVVGGHQISGLLANDRAYIAGQVILILADKAVQKVLKTVRSGRCGGRARGCWRRLGRYRDAEYPEKVLHLINRWTKSFSSNLSFTRIIFYLNKTKNYLFINSRIKFLN